VAPKISVILCTVRGDHGYADFPAWSTIGKIIADLAVQTFRDFELIIVDGLHGVRQLPLAVGVDYSFFVKWVPPRKTLWTEAKKVAISTYRNTGLTYARGELIVNLDDCCVLPPIYLEVLWTLYKDRGVCGALTWPEQRDMRLRAKLRMQGDGRVTQPGEVYGFGSFPLEMALDLNGYDEAYDGSQALEDIDWSTRLFHSGLRQVLVEIPGFGIPHQTPHDPRAIDLAESIVRCCNMSWQTQRVRRRVRRANVPEIWEDHDARRSLIGPCLFLLPNGMCGHHGGRQECGYKDRAWVLGGHPLANRLLDEPPVFDLAAARKEVLR
jgi:hypothetical protein